MSRYLVDRIERTPAIEVLLDTEVGEADGDKALEALCVESNRTGERRRIEARALFVFIGAAAVHELARRRDRARREGLRPDRARGRPGRGSPA